jgi:hypothetical protein
MYLSYMKRALVRRRERGGRRERDKEGGGRRERKRKEEGGEKERGKERATLAHHQRPKFPFGDTRCT